MIAELVYLCCMLMSAACAVLLIRRYTKDRGRFLLWSAICFFGIALNNAVLFLDLAILPEAIDLSVFRAVILVLSLFVLIYGFVWETR